MGRCTLEVNSIEENGGGGGVMRKMLKGLQEGPHTCALVPPCLITGLMGTGCQPMMVSYALCS